MWIDLHIHTRGSDGVSGAPEIVRAALARGLGGIAITDHHRTYTPEGDAVAEEAERAGLVVVRGCEYSTAWGHCLIYGVDMAEFAHEHPGYYPEMTTVAAWAHARGGVVVPSHPYAGYIRMLGDRLIDVRCCIDAVETYNGQAARRAPVANRRARMAADQYGIVAIGGSDAHVAAHVGACYTVVPDTARTPEAVLQAIRDGHVMAGAERRPYHVPLMRRGGRDPRWTGVLAY